MRPIATMGYQEEEADNKWPHEQMKYRTKSSGVFKNEYNHRVA
jgi:hypothetical protein